LAGRGIAAWKRQSGKKAAARSHRVTVEERERRAHGIPSPTKKSASGQGTEFRGKSSGHARGRHARASETRQPLPAGLVMSNDIARLIENALQYHREIAAAQQRLAVLRVLIDRKKQQDELRAGRKNYMTDNKARNARTHKLCGKAGLLERAEILDVDDEVLLGAFMKIREGLQHEARVESWRKIGRIEFLKCGKTGKKPRQLIVRFLAKPLQTILDVMNGTGFDYASVTASWSGEGDLDYARELIRLAGVGGTAEALPAPQKSKAG
jgi:hypothetical protein